MRRGRALLPHPRIVHTDDGRRLVTRQMVAHALDRHPNLVRRIVPAVACDAKTRVALLDLDDAERRLAAIPRRLPKRRPLVHTHPQ